MTFLEAISKKTSTPMAVTPRGAFKPATPKKVAKQEWEQLKEKVIQNEKKETKEKK